MTSLFKFASFLMIAASLAACSVVPNDDKALQDLLDHPEEFKSMNFYVGGGAIRRGDPTFTHDLAITFTNNGNAQLSGKTYGESCKKTGSLDHQEVRDLTNVLQALKFDTNDKAVEDSGTSEIVITLKDSSKTTIHLQKYSANEGELYAVNGDLAETYLSDIDDSLFCK